MFKFLFIRGSIGGLIFTLLLAFTLQQEVSFFDIKNPFMAAVILASVFFVSSSFISAFIFAISCHIMMRHKGWKRILFILSLVLVPASIFLTFNNNHVSGAFGHFIAIALPSILSYVVIIALFYAVVFLYNWVKDGFRKLE
jgi:hypothetical protein